MAPASKEAVGWPGISIRQRHLAQLLRSIKGSPRACPAHPAGRAGPEPQPACKAGAQSFTMGTCSAGLPGPFRAMMFGVWNLGRAMTGGSQGFAEQFTARDWGGHARGLGAKRAPMDTCPTPYPQSTPSPLPPTCCCLGWWLGWAAYCCPRNV